MLLTCWNRGLDLLYLGGFDVDDCIAVGVMLSAALGKIHSRDFQRSHI